MVSIPTRSPLSTGSSPASKPQVPGNYLTAGAQSHAAAALPDLHPRRGLCDRLPPRDDGRFDQWCPALRCAGISVGYRLAPETPFPGPLEDCYAALRWAYRNADDLGIDPGRIAIIGGSAGGGLAAGLALLARDRAEIPVAFQVLSYPMLDDRMATPSGRAGAPLWGPAANQFGWCAYLSGLSPDDDLPGYAVPARASELAGLPPAFITVGNLDGLLDEDIDYARRLIAAGVPTDLHVFAGAPHAFDSMLAGTAVARRAARVLEDWLESRLHPE
jgi:acetyl esterase/lipase